MVSKTNLLFISVLVSGIVTFMSKRKVLYDFPPKYIKTTESHNLAVCSSHCGEKLFFVNIYPLLHFFVKKSCLNKFKFSSGFAPFQTR